MKRKTSTSYDLPSASNLLLGLALALVSAVAFYQHGRAARLETILDAVEDQVLGGGGGDDDDEDDRLDDEAFKEHLDHMRHNYEEITICRGAQRGCTRVRSNGNCPDCFVFTDDDPRSTEEIIKDFRRVN